MGKRSSSPYLSRVTNNPLLSSVIQGRSLPSDYVPVKVLQSPVTSPREKNVMKNLLDVSKQSKSMKQVFKPTSPSSAMLNQTVGESNAALFQKTSSSSNPGPIFKTNSKSNNTSVNANMCTRNVSPALSHSVGHSTLDVSKTSATDKRLRKENLDTSLKSSKRKSNFGKNERDYGLVDMIASLPSSPNSPKIKTTQQILADLQAKKNDNLSPSSLSQTDSLHSSKAQVSRKKSQLLRNPKEKSFDEKEFHDNRRSDNIVSLSTGSKLPEVKTTQQLIPDLQAKKDVNVPPGSFLPIDSLHSSEAEVSRTKSELIQKWLTAQSEKKKCGQNPADVSIVSIKSDNGSHFGPHVSSVINEDSDIATRISHRDSVDEEIERILSSLPPINPAEINLEEDDSLTDRPTSVTSDDLNKLEEPWEYVNGMYDCNGAWRSWQECSEEKSLGRRLLILPYINID